MGYYIQTPQTSFAIRTMYLPRFFELVTTLMSDENIEENGHGGSFGPNGKTRGWYSWVKTDDVRSAAASNDIIRVFAAWGYDLELVNETNGLSNYYLDIRGGDAKIGDEETFFAAIAPVVEDGSFIDVRGEDGGEWRWMWENGKFYSQDIIRKDVIYGEPNEIAFQNAHKNKEIA